MAQQQQFNASDALSVEHLSCEAIAALVDGELSRRAEHRAKVHLVHCQSCRDEVQQQRQAAERLRGECLSDSCGVRASESLIERLTKIPENCGNGESSGASQRGPAPSGHNGRRGAHRFGVDGRRKPETLIDGVELLIRRLQRKTKS